MPSQKRAESVYNAISYIIPPEFEDPIKQVLQNQVQDLNNKQIMMVLLNLPIKDFNDGHPHFTFAYHDLVRTQVNLAKFQLGFEGWLEKQIEQIMASIGKR